jgi:hypothetical protein
MNEKAEFKITLKHYSNTHSFYPDDQFLFDFMFYIDFTFVYVYLKCLSCMVYVSLWVILTNLGSMECIGLLNDR